jgi:hypothetical protein
MIRPLELLPEHLTRAHSSESRPNVGRRPALWCVSSKSVLHQPKVDTQVFLAVADPGFGIHPKLPNWCSSSQFHSSKIQLGQKICRKVPWEFETPRR